MVRVIRSANRRVITEENQNNVHETDVNDHDKGNLKKNVCRYF